MEYIGDEQYLEVGSQVTEDTPVTPAEVAVPVYPETICGIGGTFDYYNGSGENGSMEYSGDEQ